MLSKQLRSLIPYIPIIAISAGLIKHIVFYKFFGIEVIDFISLNEVLVLFAEDLLSLFLYLVIILVVGYFTTDIVNELTLSEEKRIQIKKENLKTFKYFFIIYLILVSSTYILILINIKYFFSLFGLALFLLQLTPVAVLYYILVDKEKYNANISKISVLFVFLTFLFLVYSYMIAIYEAVSAKNGKYLGSKIITTGSTYSSDSNHYYIGKTDKYVFIYNKSDSTSTVLPISEIKRFIIKEKP